MKAFVINGKLDGSFVELPIPEPAANQVRIRIAYVGICGSDLHYFYEGQNGAFVINEPLIPGHELSGEIDFDPSGDFAKGTYVTLHPATFGEEQPGLEGKPHLWPNGGYLGSASTTPHTQGAMVEFFIADKSMVRALPQGLSLATASLAEPLAVAIHAINTSGGIVGKNILVSGAGPIGLLTIAASKILGASDITATDLFPAALQRAESVGATHLIAIKEQEIPENFYDVIFECSGSSLAVSSALRAVKRGGVIVQVGMLSGGTHAIAIAPLVSKEVQLRGTFRFNNEINDAIVMLSENKWLEKVITHTFQPSDMIEAFESAKNSNVSGKVIVDLREFSLPLTD